jgi:ubiquinone/menaquinone biosynthesis C-methylase UbiE
VSRPRGGWDAIDQTKDPAAFVDYLRSVSALDSVQLYKQKTFPLMGAAAGKRVLDVGCGHGDEVIALARIVGERGQAVGVDASAAMVAEATSRAAAAGVRADFQVADAHSLPFPDASFDGCRIERTLQHLANPDLAIRELRRVCRPGGCVVAMDPDWAALSVDSADADATYAIVRAHASHVRHGHMGRELWSRFARAGLADLVVEAGVAPITSFDVADTVVGLSEGAREAVEDGVLEEARADEWLVGLRRADAEGRFFASLVGVIVSGRVPAS